jgi:hypothetical protein
MFKQALGEVNSVTFKSISRKNGMQVVSKNKFSYGVILQTYTMIYLINLEFYVKAW